MLSTSQTGRRSLLRNAALLTGAALLRLPVLADAVLLPLRADGEMDIHHIDTGRGNCTLIVCPDGTSIMVDAGAATVQPETTGPQRPDGARRPGQTVARYATKYVADGKLDYFIATHLHPDHIGDVSQRILYAPGKPYQLTGISDVDAVLPINTVIDRGYPDYSGASPLAAPFVTNYLSFLRDRVQHGRAVEKARVGADDQIVPRHSSDGRFRLRILSANAQVWKRAAAGVQQNENLDSISFRLDCGRFSYYTGGDLTSATNDGVHPELDIETPVARACGRVEVAACNHHAYFDAVGPEFVRALDARAYILQTWDIGHPGPAQLERLTASWTGHSADVFATGLVAANQLSNRRFLPLMKSTRGHVIVRVAAGGNSYTIFITDSSREEVSVLASFGPYRSRT